MKRAALSFFVLIILVVYSFGQSLQKNKRGVVIYNKPFFKHFAILMKDTILGGNRFDNWFDKPQGGDYTTKPYEQFTLPAFIIDSVLFCECEVKLLSNSPNVDYYSYPKFPSSNAALKKNLKKYIRLYVGFIDTSGERKVVVQFITMKEFKKNENIYSVELFLIVKQEKLRFAVIDL